MAVPTGRSVVSVTGNANKLEEVGIQILGDKFPYKLVSKKIDFTYSKCKVTNYYVSVCELLKMPLGIGPGQFKMLAGFEDKSAWALCTFAFCPGKEEPVQLFRGITERPRDFGWDPCFQLPKEVKNTISHRYQALAAMSEHFSSQDNGTPDSKKKIWLLTPDQIT
uniref:Inosine triphosphatase (nucleoside triphosphate pyrophosphatase) n=1 Tax=Oncorhynchus kisutch TaxID=8019 RepID=A0A8C7M683_ONCKI